MPLVWPWQRGRDRRGGDSSRGVAEGSPGSPLADPEFVAGLRPIPTASPDRAAPWPAADLAGVTPVGDPIEVRIDGRGALSAPMPRRWLLAFLHTDCVGCDEFWRGFRDPDGIGLPAGVSSVVVTKGPESSVVADVARSASGIDQVQVVMSDQAWADYRVLGYPFFVLVDVASRAVVGETVGFGWGDVVGMVASVS